MLPERSAFVAYFANRDPAVPLLFHRDIVIRDAVGDEGEDAPVIIRELLAQGRRVFLLKSGFSPELLDRVMERLRRVRNHDHEPGNCGVARASLMIDTRAIPYSSHRRVAGGLNDSHTEYVITHGLSLCCHTRMGGHSGSWRIAHGNHNSKRRGLAYGPHQ